MYYWIASLLICASCVFGKSSFKQVWMDTASRPALYEMGYKHSGARLDMGLHLWRREGESVYRPHRAFWLRAHLPDSWHLGVGAWSPSSDGVLFGSLRRASLAQAPSLSFRPRPGHAGRMNPEYSSLLLYRERGRLRAGLWWARTLRDESSSAAGFLQDLYHKQESDHRQRAWKDHLKLAWVQGRFLSDLEALLLAGQRSSRLGRTPLYSLRIQKGDRRQSLRFFYTEAASKRVGVQSKFRLGSTQRLSLLLQGLQADRNSFASLGIPDTQGQWCFSTAFDLRSREREKSWQLQSTLQWAPDSTATWDQSLRFRQAFAVAARSGSLFESVFLGLFLQSRGVLAEQVHQSKVRITGDFTLWNQTQLHLAWTRANAAGEKGRNFRVTLRAKIREQSTLDLAWRVDLSQHHGGAPEWQALSLWPGLVRFQRLADDDLILGLSIFARYHSEAPYLLECGLRAEKQMDRLGRPDRRVGLMFCIKRKDRSLPKKPPA
jgi:hypothetical protein